MPSCIDDLSQKQVSDSPFERLLAFDVYDGPLSGVVTCRKGDEAFLFRLLAWDKDQQRRVFSLSRLLPGALKRLTDVLEGLETPRWPEWWLRAEWSEEQGIIAKEELDRIVRDAGPVESVVVCRRMLASIEHARRVSTPTEKASFARMSTRTAKDDEVTDTPFESWLEFIGGGGD